MPNQILQFMGKDTLARSLSSVIYDGHYISAHHPVLLTYFYGLFWEIGNAVNNVNLLVFLLSLICMLICSAASAYMLHTIMKNGSCGLSAALLMVMCVYPVYGTYAHTLCKDNLYTAGIIVFVSMLINDYFDDSYLNDKKVSIAFVFICILIPFLKNQGIYIVVITLIITALVKRGSHRRKVLLATGMSVFVYIIIFSHILLPLMKISPGGRQEMLSLPFNQTALYVKLYGSEQTEEEIQIINQVLPYNSLPELYQEDRADSVKFSFKQDATTGELISYFKVYIEEFFHHPKCYIKAFVSLTDGYYNIFNDSCILDLSITGTNVEGATNPEWVNKIYEKEETIWEHWRKTPVICVLFRVAFPFYVMIATVISILLSKMYGLLLSITPIFLSWLVCLVGPWNSVMRYALPEFWALPIFIFLICKTVSQVYLNIKFRK